MNDPADERAAFREAMARAEANAVEYDEDGRETPAQADTNELLDAVPVSGSDQPLEPETETPSEPEETVETPVSEETPDELRDQIAKLEERLAEKDSMIGRQSGEVGELRQAIDELNRRLETPAEPTRQAPPLQPVTEDLIENDPATATVLAFQQGNQPAFVRAYQTWSEYSPAEAANWINERRIEQAQAENQAKLDAMEQRLQQFEAPAAQQAVTNEWNRAFSLANQQAPGLLETDPEGVTYVERLLQNVAPEYPALHDALANGNAETKANALKLLYQIDRAKNTDPSAVSQQLEDAAKAAATEEAATRAAAAVVSGQPTAGQGGAPELTWEQEEQAKYQKRFGEGVSVERNWTGRS